MKNNFETNYLPIFLNAISSKYFFSDLELTSLKEVCSDSEILDMQHDQEEILNYLVKKSIDLDSTYSFEQLNNLGLIDLNSKIEYRILSKEPLPLLHIACALEKTNLAEFLLENGVKHDTKLPLLTRSRRSTEKEIRSLFSEDSGKSFLIKPGDTALSIAERLENRFLIELLEAVELSSLEAKARDYSIEPSHLEYLQTPLWLSEVSVRGFDDAVTLPTIFAGEPLENYQENQGPQKESGSLSPFAG